MRRLALACSLLLTACVADVGDVSEAATGNPSDTGDQVTGSSSGAAGSTGPGDPSSPLTGGPGDTGDDDTGEPATTGSEGPCGDGKLDEYESCDEGPNNADDGACTTACRFAVCGDGLVHAGVELCDDGNLVNTDTCLVGCLPARCGDGYAGPGEVCDDGNAVDDDDCPNSCSAGGCGDGFVQVGETCDDGNLSDTDACLSNCQLAQCGDGVVQFGVEDCDDGNAVDGDTCSNACTLPSCDDGVDNGFESDVDCGGNSCDGCSLGQKCVTNLDCAASICDEGECSPPRALVPIDCAPANVTVAQAYGAVKSVCGCHGNGAGGLQFKDAATFKSDMVGVAAATADMLLVAPNDIGHSYLIFKILNQHTSVVGGHGSPMPINKPLSEAQKCMLINWVKSGAG